MAELKPFDPVLALGRALTKELQLDDSVDTLSRWMAHYIAELIVAVDQTEPGEQATAQAACHSAILDLWKHRHVMPNGKRPFESVEPILRTLESLDADAGVPRYFRSLPAPDADDRLDPERTRWLEIASNIDQTARTLVLHCIANAASSGKDSGGEWVRLATEAAAELDIEAPLFRIVFREHAATAAPELDDGLTKLLESRLDQLEVFSRSAAALRRDLKRKIQESRATIRPAQIDDEKE